LCKANSIQFNSIQLGPIPYPYRDLDPYPALDKPYLFINKYLLNMYFIMLCAVWSDVKCAVLPLLAYANPSSLRFCEFSPLTYRNQRITIQDVRMSER
jgi:hypothetical protein